MKRNYKYLLSLFPALLIVFCNLKGGWWVAGNAVFSLLILAVLERFVANDKTNDEDSNIFFPDLILHLHVLLQVFVLISSVYAIKTFDSYALQLILLALSVGINTGGSAIVIAHELIHRKNKWPRFLGKFLLLTACNIYFYVDHLRIHHKWVGTEKDHATARYGESVYAFFIRSVKGQIAGSWKLEIKRLDDRNVFQRIFDNYVIVSMMLIVALCVAVFYFYGWSVVVFFLMQSFVANFLLEYTNYIEHYGLTRKESERVTELHSWQSDKVISRYFLIDLSRHADHHYYASKPYHTLKSYEKAPVLPGGYVQMIYYALIPPLWFAAMHTALKNRS